MPDEEPRRARFHLNNHPLKHSTVISPEKSPRDQICTTGQFSGTTILVVHTSAGMSQIFDCLVPRNR